MRFVTTALMCALVLAGCGGQTPQASGTSPSPVDNAYEQNLKFAQCMREHGVNIPDPEPGKPPRFLANQGTSQEKVQAAIQACRQFAPKGLLDPAQQEPQQAEAMRKFAQCMRDNGVEKFPDPDSGALRMTEDIANDPDFKAAQEKCTKEFLPQAGTR
jgi:hypothetical protein